MTVGCATRPSLDRLSHSLTMDQPHETKGGDTIPTPHIRRDQSAGPYFTVYWSVCLRCGDERGPFKTRKQAMQLYPLCFGCRLKENKT